MKNPPIPSKTRKLHDTKVIPSKRAPAPKAAPSKVHPRSWLRRQDGSPIPAKHSLVNDTKTKKPSVTPAAEPKTKAPKTSKKGVASCSCGCGQEAVARLVGGVRAASFRPGHDAKLHSAVIKLTKGTIKIADVPALKDPVAVAWILSKPWGKTAAAQKAMGLV